MEDRRTPEFGIRRNPSVAAKHLGLNFAIPDELAKKHLKIKTVKHVQFKDADGKQIFYYLMSTAKISDKIIWLNCTREIL